MRFINLLLIVKDLLALLFSGQIVSHIPNQSEGGLMMGRGFLRFLRLPFCPARLWLCVQLQLSDNHLLIQKTDVWTQNNETWLKAAFKSRLFALKAPDV